MIETKKKTKVFEINEMKIPAILFSQKRDFSEDDTLKKIEKIGNSNQAFHHIAVLSEAHSKPNIKNPTGSVVAVKDKIVPEFIDAAPNCGMRIIKTGLKKEDLSVKKIKELFKALQKDIPTSGLTGQKISSRMVTDIFLKGSQAIKKTFPLETKNEMRNTYAEGNFFFGKNISKKGLFEAIPSLIFWLGRFRLKLLGATKSHFIYLVKVSQIKDFDLAEKLGIKKDQYLFFMHTGSSIVGRYLASLYTPRKIKNSLQRLILLFIYLFSNKKQQGIFKKIKKLSGQKGITGFSLDSEEGKSIEIAFRAVNNYGFANRALITQQINQTLKKVFGKEIYTELLYDAPHVYFEKEKHFGEEVIVHRNGANRAFGPSKMSFHPIFFETGEPVLIAPFADKLGYLAVGLDENQETFFSVNHEIGKEKELRVSKEEYSNYAREISQEIEDNQIAKIVAELKPVEKLTY